MILLLLRFLKNFRQNFHYFKGGILPCSDIPLLPEFGRSLLYILKYSNQFCYIPCVTMGKTFEINHTFFSFFRALSLMMLLKLLLEPMSYLILNPIMTLLLLKLNIQIHIRYYFSLWPLQKFEK